MSDAARDYLCALVGADSTTITVRAEDEQHASELAAAQLTRDLTTDARPPILFLTVRSADTAIDADPSVFCMTLRDERDEDCADGRAP